MKKTITIIFIVIAALGLGYFLFSLSPKSPDDLNTDNTLNITEPRPAGPGDYVLGKAEAKNTMVVYEDFECPACASYSSIVEQFPAGLQDTKVVYRHYPLPQHKNAVPAAFAAEAAGAQGKFWEMAKQLYANQDQWAGADNPTEQFARLAQAVGVADLEKFKTDMQNQIGKDKIQADITEASSLKIRGTPSLYFNGKPVELGSLDQVKARVEKFYK